jgi:hypothetical protein
MKTNAENPTTGSSSSSTEDPSTGESSQSSVSPEAQGMTGESSPTVPIVPTASSTPTPPSMPTAPLPPTPTYFPTATAAATAAVSATPSRPHVRWGGVVWGALLVAIAGFVLFTVSSRARQSAFESWVAGLTPGAGWTLAVVAVGVFILILALLAVVRSAQRGRRA